MHEKSVIKEYFNVEFSLSIWSGEDLSDSQQVDLTKVLEFEGIAGKKQKLVSSNHQGERNLLVNAAPFEDLPKIVRLCWTLCFNTLSAAHLLILFVIINYSRFT